MFVLLIIFATAVQPPEYFRPEPNLFRHAIPIPASLRDDSLKITLTRDGPIYLGNSRVAREDLSEQIRERLQSGSQHMVFLVVDPRARYADLSVVLDEARYGGVWQVAFLAESPFLHR